MSFFSVFKLTIFYMSFSLVFLLMIREGFKNPRHGNFPLGGCPRGLHGRDFPEKLGTRSERKTGLCGKNSQAADRPKFGTSSLNKIWRKTREGFRDQKVNLGF